MAIHAWQPFPDGLKNNPTTTWDVSELYAWKTRFVHTNTNPRRLYQQTERQSTQVHDNAPVKSTTLSHDRFSSFMFLSDSTDIATSTCEMKINVRPQKQQKTVSDATKLGMKTKIPFVSSPFGKVDRVEPWMIASPRDDSFDLLGVNLPLFKLFRNFCGRVYAFWCCFRHFQSCDRLVSLDFQESQQRVAIVVGGGFPAVNCSSQAAPPQV